MNWKDKLRVGTGIVLLCFIGLFFIYLMVCKFMNADISFSNYLKAFCILLLCIGGLYCFITFIKWCFKPLEKNE